MTLSIYTIRVQGADGRIVPASFRASSREAAESMALARGFDVIVSADSQPADAGSEPPPPSALEGGALFLGEEPPGRPATAALSKASILAATRDHEPIDPGRIAPWAFCSWLLPFIALALGYWLGKVLPLDGASRLAASCGFVLLLIIGLVMAVKAIRAGSRRGRTGAVIHGIVGLVIGLPVLLVIGSAVLLPGITVLRRAADQSLHAEMLAPRESALAPYASGGGTVTGCSAAGGAVVRAVDMPGEAPSGAALHDAAAAHRSALLEHLPRERRPFVDALRTLRLRLVDRLRWEAGADAAIEVEIGPRDWPGEAQPR